MTDWPNQQPGGTGGQPIAPQPAPGQPWGAAVPQWSGYASPPATALRPGNGLAVAALVLGITSIVFSWWGILTLVQVVLAIVFGAKGIGRANRGAPHKGLAVAGLVLGIIGCVFYIFIGLASFGLGWVI